MKNNNGMAFVSVMIAILFVGMLTTSLCFMAYSNHQAKATRWSSENNFYYDEWALDELSSQLRQQAQQVGDAVYHLDEDNNDRLTEFIKALSSAAGVSPADDGNYKSTHAGVWTPADMQNLLQVTNNSKFQVKVEVAERGPATYIREKKTIRFKNIKLIVTEIDPSSSTKNFTTTIVTDIVIPGETTAAGIPVNDFSLMSDRKIEWGGGIWQMSGNFFCIDNATAATHTGNALVLDHGSQVTMSGRKSLIVGNLVVKGGSKLYLNNEVTITGELIIEDSSMVYAYGNNVMASSVSNMDAVVGKIKVRPELQANGNSVFCGSGRYGNGLATAIIDDVSFITAYDGTTATVVTLDSTTDGNFHDSSVGAELYGANNNRLGNTAATGAKVKMSADEDFTSQPNQLVFLGFNPSHGHTRLRGDYLNTTIIAPIGSSEFSNDPMEAPNMSKLNAEDYQSCLNTLVAPNEGTFYDPNGNVVSTMGGSKALFDAAVSDFKTNLAAGHPENSNYYVETMPNKAGADRYRVFDKVNGKPLIPWGYFIAEDADIIIGDAFSTIRDKNDEGAEYKIVYENWVKE